MREVLYFNWKKSSAEDHQMVMEAYVGFAPIGKLCRSRRFKSEDSIGRCKLEPSPPLPSRDHCCETLSTTTWQKTNRKCLSRWLWTQRCTFQILFFTATDCKTISESTGSDLLQKLKDCWFHCHYEGVSKQRCYFQVVIFWHLSSKNCASNRNRIIHASTGHWNY